MSCLVCLYFPLYILVNIWTKKNVDTGKCGNLYLACYVRTTEFLMMGSFKLHFILGDKKETILIWDLKRKESEMRS